MNNLSSLFLFVVYLFCNSFESCSAQTSAEKLKVSKIGNRLKTGASQVEVYLPYLQGKRVALLVNQTTVIETTHLADSLLNLKVNIVKIFSPEHGFRGEAEAGALVANAVDKKTGLAIVSLYGKNKKPSKESLADVDLVIFDIQDVGARFFTYISSLHYLMQACAENNKEILILDRPNPHGHYIDGPILEPKYRSFVGMHPIPIVHGLTIGELAGMINGEKWLDSGITCRVKVIKVEGYTHKTPFFLPIKPSPNLPDDQSVKLYPSLCLFEGTAISLGRGTAFPFQVLGAPDKVYGDFVFTPRSIEGVAKTPMYEGKDCYGIDLRKAAATPNLNLKYLLDFYARSQEKEKFFIPFFNTLAGTASLQEQIKQGWDEGKIKLSWKSDLEKYQSMRKKYLLYADF